MTYLTRLDEVVQGFKSNPRTKIMFGLFSYGILSTEITTTRWDLYQMFAIGLLMMISMWISTQMRELNARSDSA